MTSSLSETTLFEDLMQELEALHISPGADEAIVPDVRPAPVDMRTSRIWIIDDASVNVKVVRRHLNDEGYGNVEGFTNPRVALQQLDHKVPDTILLDIMMPEMSGIEVLKVLRSRLDTAHTPILILSASNDRETRLEALDLGATDFLAKPVDRVELIARLRNVLRFKSHHDHLQSYSVRLEEAVKQRTAELAASRLEIVHCLARASEFRDDITGRHVFRVGRYAGIIGSELGLPPQQAHLLELAAQLHDVGKIAIPDSILLKQGKLEPEEYSYMQRHCGFGKRVFDPINHNSDALREHTSLGGELLGTAQSPLIRLASRIALTHHEWWDGSGYPLGLAGDDIPLEGRITAVADVFDALGSRRPYKEAYPLSKCFEILSENRGTQFDPDVLDAFMRRRSDIIDVQLEHADLEEL